MTWCYLQETDSVSAPGPVALILASCLPSLTSTPDALLSGRNTPGNPSSQASGPDTSPPRRSGTTSQPSTPDPSGARSTLCLPDTHASRSVPRVSEKAQTTNATYGRMSPASLPSFGPDGSFLKTSRDTFHLASIPCCEKYGTWATRLRLAYSQRRKSVQVMSGSGSSSWPTARASEQENRTTQRAPSHGNGHGEVLAGVACDVVNNWPTPTPMQTRDGWSEGELTAAREKAKAAANNGNGFGLGLGAAASVAQASWMTPRTVAGEYTRDGGAKGGPNMSFGAGGTPLPAQAATWPTPAAHQDTRGAQATPEAATDREARGHQLALADRAILFSHPDQVTPAHGATLSDLLRIWRPLRASVIASHGRATWRRLMKARNKRRLNPGFVEWLMGWPPGHALCDCSGMEFAHWQQHMRSALSQQPIASGPWIWKPPAPEAAAMQLDMFGGES